MPWTDPCAIACCSCWFPHRFSAGAGLPESLPARPSADLFWCRGQGAPFRWRWDNSAWQECSADAPWADLVQFHDHGGYGWIELAWVCLGLVDLTRGCHVLGVGNTPDDASVGFDSWLLTRGEFTPLGANKPPG